MKVGVTLVFKEKKNQIITGVLKSLVLDVEIENFNNETDKLGNKIAEYFDFDFLGINDVFVVTGEPNKEEILGRTSYFEYNNITKAEELKNQFLKIETGTFLCSLIYFCSNKSGEKFTLTVLTIIDLIDNLAEKEITKIANKVSFKNKIIEVSVDEINEINFIGVEYIEKTDLKFNVFETLYSDFDFIETLLKEILSSDNLEKILKDIFKE